MTRLIQRIGSGCAAAALLVVGGWFTAAQAAEPTPGALQAGEQQEALAARDAQIAALVRALGDAEYVTRQRASRELSRLGAAAQGALLKALNSEDAEIRHRARQLLANVLENDLTARVDAFASDLGGAGEPKLPGWNAYRDLVGDTADTRKLFVELLRAEPVLMESIEIGPLEALRALQVRCNALQNEMRQPQLVNGMHVQQRVPIGTVAAFFLASSDERAPVDENIGRIIQSLLYQSSFQSDINSGARSEPLRRMLGRWIVRNRSANMAYQGLHFSMQYNLKEGRELGEHLIRGGGQPAHLLQSAVLVVGRFGAKSDIETLAPLLRDESPLQFGGQPGAFQQELRDVALAVSIHLSGQQPGDYGYAQVQPNPQMLYNPGSLVFASPATRDAAFKKWEAWRTKHLPDGTPLNPPISAPKPDAAPQPEEEIAAEGTEAEIAVEETEASDEAAEETP